MRFRVASQLAGDRGGLLSGRRCFLGLLSGLFCFLLLVLRYSRGIQTRERIRQKH